MSRWPRDLFTLTLGATFALHGRPGYGKFLLPGEVAGLLDGNLAPERRVIQQETPVLLGEMTDPPPSLTAPLVRFFEGNSQVRSAHLAVMKMGDETSLLLGIEAEKGFDRLVQDLGTVLDGCLPPGQMLDIVQIKPGDEGPSGFFLRTAKPFYKRSLWRSLWGRG